MSDSEGFGDDEQEESDEDEDVTVNTLGKKLSDGPAQQVIANIAGEKERAEMIARMISTTKHEIAGIKAHWKVRTCLPLHDTVLTRLGCREREKGGRARLVNGVPIKPRD